jgi:hypothetical protein
MERRYSVVEAARCPWCYEVVSLRPDGLLMQHPHRSIAGAMCVGSVNIPLKEQVSLLED